MAPLNSITFQEHILGGQGFKVGSFIMAPHLLKEISGSLYNCSDNCNIHKNVRNNLTKVYVSNADPGIS